jgi:hypothetical protein
MTGRVCGRKQLVSAPRATTTDVQGTMAQPLPALMFVARRPWSVHADYCPKKDPSGHLWTVISPAVHSVNILCLAQQPGPLVVPVVVDLHCCEVTLDETCSLHLHAVAELWVRLHPQLTKPTGMLAVVGVVGICRGWTCSIQQSPAVCTMQGAGLRKLTARRASTWYTTGVAVLQVDQLQYWILWKNAMTYNWVTSKVQDVCQLSLDRQGVADLSTVSCQPVPCIGSTAAQLHMQPRLARLLLSYGQRTSTRRAVCETELGSIPQCPAVVHAGGWLGAARLCSCCEQLRGCEACCCGTAKPRDEKENC